MTKRCSNRELAYAQWYNYSVLADAPVGANPQGLLTMVEFEGSVTPFHHELRYFYELKNASLPDLSLEEVFSQLQGLNVSNPKAIGDSFLNITDENNPFSSETWTKYLKMVIITKGLNGLFSVKTPEQMIEGYYDPTLLDAS